MALFHRLVVSAAFVVAGIMTYSLRESSRASAAEPAGPNAAIAVKVRFFNVSEICWEYLRQKRSAPFLSDLGIQFADDGEHKRPVALLDDKQTFLVLEAIQGDRGSKMLLAPKLTVANGQQATLSIASLEDLTRGAVLPWDEDPAKAEPRSERGVAGVQLVVRPTLGDEQAASVTLKARLIKADHPYLALADQPRESRFLGGPVNTTVTVPKQGAALVGAWKVVRKVDHEFGPPVLSKIYQTFINRVSHEREVDVILILVTPRVGQIEESQ